VRHGSPASSPGQGLSGEGTMLNLSQLEYWTAFKRRKDNIAKTKGNIFIFIPDNLL
jgi:hypothetical protein